MADIFYLYNQAELRQREDRTEMPISYGGEPLLIADRSSIDGALVSTVVFLATILVGLTSIFWLGTR
jgi:hypothetical protein